MRILGLDLGERRIGVALSDPLGLTAQPLTVLERRNPTADLQTLCGLVAKHGVERVVLGLPLSLRGTRGPAAQRAEDFGRRLEAVARIPVHFMDERLTTVQGQRVLREMATAPRKRKQVIDRVAAQLILQQYLEMEGHGP